MKIIVTCDGKNVGYVKGINEEMNSFSITTNEKGAKMYDNVDEIQGEIDTLTRINDNFIYLYE